MICLVVLLTFSQAVVSADLRNSSPEAHSTSWSKIIRQMQEVRRAQTTVTEAVTTSTKFPGKADPYMSLNYLNSFRIAVYAIDDNVYSYTPALILDQTSAQSSFNRLTNKYEVTFSVLMWDEMLEDFVRSKVSQKTGAASPVVRVLPIQQIRFTSVGHTADFSFVDKWQPYYNQPSFFKFRVNCINQAKCDQLASDIKTNPEQSVQDLTIYFTFDQPKSSEAKIEVKKKHVLESELFTNLEQKMPNQELVVMAPDNLRRMLTEAANEAVKKEAAEGQFIAQDQVPSIVRALETALKAEIISTVSFDTKAWESVFWVDETQQPDSITRTLNQLYNESSASMREAIKNEFKLMNLSGGVQRSTKLVSNQAVVALSNFLTAENENILGLVNDAKNLSSWDGEKFVVAPIRMRRVNLTAFRSDETIASVKVKAWTCSSEPGYRINVIATSPNDTSLAGINSALYRMQQRLSSLENDMAEAVMIVATKAVPKTGTIQMLFSATVPKGWLACDGGAINCTTHHQLCSLIGNFTPNFHGRFPMGINGTSGQVGTLGGEAEHMLSVGEMPSHTHSYAKLASPKVTKMYTDTAGGQNGWTGNAVDNESLVNATGGSKPHNNLPPFVTVNFVIKT